MKGLQNPPTVEAPKPPPAPPVPIVQPTPAEKPVAIAKAEPPQIPPSPVSLPSEPVEPKVVKASPQEKSVPPPPDEAPSFTAESQVDLEEAFEAFKAETQVEGRKHLAIYDLDAVEQYKIVALILSEALREELFRLGQFTLVNRENLLQVLKEIELQQTGLLDEKYAVQAGKGLAASQIVMGRYGALGQISVLQAKRVDVETQGTLAIGSLKCDLGREEELLRQMSVLARKLAEGP